MKTMTANTGKLKSLIVIIMLSVLFNGSIYAQKSINSFDLASYSSTLFRNSKVEIMRAIYNLNISENYFLEMPMEFEYWMLHLEEWDESMESYSAEEMFYEAELDFQGWMFETNWSVEETFQEDELQFESWMMTPEKWSKN